VAGMFDGKFTCFGLTQMLADGSSMELGSMQAARPTEFIDVELTVSGDKITMLADGVPVVTAHAAPLRGDSPIVVLARDGRSLFKKIEVKDFTAGSAPSSKTK
jgi:hypothetical protein